MLVSGHRIASAGAVSAFRPRVGQIVDGIGAAAAAVVVLAVAMAGQTGEERGNGRGQGGKAEVAAAGGPAEAATSFYFGVPYTYSSDLRFEVPGKTDLTARGVNWDGKPFKSPIYYGLRHARWMPPGSFGAMLDFTHSKAISQRDQSVTFEGTRNGRPQKSLATIGETFRHLEFSHGHNMLTLNGLMRLGPSLPWGRAYVGAGAGVALPHTEIQFLDEDRRTYEYQYAGPVGQVLVGIEIPLPRLTVFLEYKCTVARIAAPLTGNDSKGWGAGDLPGQLLRWLSGGRADGVARTTLISHQAIGGAGYRSPGAVPVPR